MAGGLGTGFTLYAHCYCCLFEDGEETENTEKDIRVARAALRERRERSGCSEHMAFGTHRGRHYASGTVWFEPKPNI